jgi:hypothetical protein
MLADVSKGLGLKYSATNDPFLSQGGYRLGGGDTREGNVPNGLYHYTAHGLRSHDGRWTHKIRLARFATRFRRIVTHLPPMTESI